MRTSPRTTLIRSGLLLVLIFVGGVAGYSVIGGSAHTIVDAIYMTTITLTTVGYGEAISLTHTSWGKIFTVGLLFVGVGSFVYFFSHVNAFVVGGGLDRLLWRNRMKREIASLSGHTIVCGVGTTGDHIVRELVATGRPFVAIDLDAEGLSRLHETLGDQSFASVVGDATDDETLTQAGIERAGGLIACTTSDKDNLIVTVSARLLNPTMRIVCRCIDQRIEAKMRKSGADAVVSPNSIGGMRMISELVRPTVVSFLDLMLRDTDKRLRVEGVPVHAGGSLDGKTVGDLRPELQKNAVLLAVALEDGGWEYNPTNEHELRGGMELIVMASPEGRSALEALASTGG